MRRVRGVRRCVSGGVWLFSACYNFVFDAAPDSPPWDRASFHARGPLAQLAEQQTLNLRVLGSIPRRLTTFLKEFTESLSAVEG